MQKELFDNDFTDIYVTESDDGATHFCYRTGMTVYEEAFDKNRLTAAGWNDSGTPLNVLEGCPERLEYDSFSRPWCFDVEADGECLSYDWELEGFKKSEEINEIGSRLLHGVVSLKSLVRPLRVEVHTILSGSAIFTRYLKIFNDSDKPVRLNRIVPICGGLEIFYDWPSFADGEKDGGGIYSLGYMANPHFCCEGDFRFKELRPGITGFGGRYDRDRHRYPAFMLKNGPLGHIWFAQLAFSGGYEFTFDLDADYVPGGINGRNSRADASLSFSMALAAPSPLYVLAPGEAFTTPDIYIGRVHGDLDDAVNMMHRHLRKCVFTHVSPKENLATVGAGIGPERAMTKEAIFHTIDTAAAVGAESLIIDAGWYCKEGEEGRKWGDLVGSWRPDKDKYGEDFREIRERCRGKGLRFGLWMECERMGKDTPIAKEHPEWYQKRWLRGADTTVIDMTDPDAAAWVRSEIERVIEEYDIDLFRLDYNIGYPSSICRTEVSGTRESSYLKYYEAVYSMFDSLRKKYPRVIFENCAGGGGRCDLGMIRHFDHTWVSDHQIPPRSVSITNGMTMVIPPERVDRLISGMNGHLMGSLDFTVRSAIFGKPTTNTFNPCGSEMNEAELSFVKRNFELYKDFIRPYMSDGYIFHHTPELRGFQPKGHCVIERSSTDGAKGVIGVFNLADVRDENVTVRPRGMLPGKRYEVTFDNSRSTVKIDGFEAINGGLKLRLPGSMTSEMIIYAETE